MNTENELMAVCGLDCTVCDIRQAPNDPELAKRIADWFKKELNTDVKLKDLRCSGCRGDRTEHWSPDCWILQCCVDKKGLGFCYECVDFPCEKLEEWANGSEKYGEALDRLKGMKK